MSFPSVTNAHQIGRVGELLAQSVLEQYVKTARVNHDGFDLLIFDDQGESYRVEVKSASRSAEDAGHRYKFMTSSGSKSKSAITPDDTDLVCYVALDIRRIVIKCVTSVVNKRTTLKASEFYVQEDLQLGEALDEVRKRRDG
jgi:hypothetical protein